MPMSLHLRLRCDRLVPMTCIWLQMLGFERPTTTNDFFFNDWFRLYCSTAPRKTGPRCTFHRPVL